MLGVNRNNILITNRDVYASIFNRLVIIGKSVQLHNYDNLEYEKQV